MSEWRLLRRWSDRELRERLDALECASRNFDALPDDGAVPAGWSRYRSHSVVATEPPGRPASEGPFERGIRAVTLYEFSDPRIVVGHFYPQRPLLGRRMLLEIRALGVLRYLDGVVVGAVRSDEAEGRTTFGFRYETLEGHIEAGAEWFLLRKDHATGAITFTIEAIWRPGQLPNWWSRIGFALVGCRYQWMWHRRAHARLRARMSGDATRPRPGALAHEGPEFVFERDTPDAGGARATRLIPRGRAHWGERRGARREEGHR